MLDFGIAFTDNDGNEHYATIYKSTDPTTIYSVHFHDENLKEEYDTLVIGVGNGALITVPVADSSIPDIRERIADQIHDYLQEHNLSVD